MILKNKFLAFLDTHEATAEYLGQLENGEAPVCDRPNNFDDFTDFHDPEDWIWDAFTWAETPSGYLSWNDLCVEWQQLLENDNENEGE